MNDYKLQFLRQESNLRPPAMSVPIYNTPYDVYLTAIRRLHIKRHFESQGAIPVDFTDYSRRGLSEVVVLIYRYTAGFSVL